MWFFLQSHTKKLDNGIYEGRTLHDFLDNCPERHRKRFPNLGLMIRTLCKGLIDDGQLFSVGFDASQRLPYSERFMSYFYLDRLADYGCYDFSALGFPEVRRRFAKSVIRLGVSMSDGEDCLDNAETSGTAFLIGNNRLATAAHCLPPWSSVRISGWDSRRAPLKSIRCFAHPAPLNPFRDERSVIDLAVLEFENNPFPRRSKFEFWRGEVLENCLVMGYPNMLSFEGLLVAGSGQVVGESFTRVRAQNLILIDARVKGGNSGGPVINKLGKVMGIITNALTDEQSEIDRLGYGLATPVEQLHKLVRALDRKRGRREKILEIPFTQSAESDVIRIQGR